jgi:hypothetical protein
VLKFIFIFCGQTDYRPINTKVSDIAHRISMRISISAVAPTIVGVNEFWSGDRVLVNVVWDAVRPGGVTICAGRLAGAGCE